MILTWVINWRVVSQLTHIYPPTKRSKQRSTNITDIPFFYCKSDSKPPGDQTPNNSLTKVAKCCQMTQNKTWWIYRQYHTPHVNTWKALVSVTLSPFRWITLTVCTTVGRGWTVTESFLGLSSSSTALGTHRPGTPGSPATIHRTFMEINGKCFF